MPHDLARLLQQQEGPSKPTLLYPWTRPELAIYSLVFPLASLGVWEKELLSLPWKQALWCGAFFHHQLPDLLKE